MLKRALRSLLLAAPAFLALALPVYAAYTLNLAGRPFGGNSDTSCQGVAYAKVDNRLSLLTAAHCCPVSNCSTGGQSVYGPTGTVIGTWGTDHGTADTDLAVIYLTPGNWPSSLNQVYRGSVSGNDYWTVAQNFTSSLGCGNLSNLIGTAYKNFQHTTATTTPYQTGHITQAVFPNPPPCIAYTDFGHQNNTKDSGSSLFSASNTQTPFGIATSVGPNNTVAFVPLYEGMRDLNSYWLSHGTLKGAKLCINATCT